MIFSVETEINGSLSFLGGVVISRENDKFVSSVFTFANSFTFTSVTSVFEIRLVECILISLVLYQLNTSFGFWYTHYWIIVLIYHLTFLNSIVKLIKLRKFLSINLPQSFIDKCIQKFLNNMFIQRPQITFVSKRGTYYHFKVSQIVKTRLTLWVNTWHFVSW